MKLLDFNEGEVLYLLNKIHEVVLINHEVYHKTETANDEGLSLTSYKELNDIIYKKMMGQTRQAVTAYFSCRGGSDKFCSAWYQKVNSSGHLEAGSLKAPGDFSGYIPDCIMDVIVSTKYTSQEKLNYLKIMMKDLEKLSSVFEYRKQVFA